MNPFTESTVARPLAHDPFGRRSQSVCPSSCAVHDPSTPTQLTVPGTPPPKAVHHPAASSAPRSKSRPLAAIVLATAGLMASVLTPHNAHAIDVNQASVDQLESVRGIGPKTAQIIIDERTRGGSYESFSDLSDRVKGIGPKKSVALQQAGLTVGGSTKAPVDTSVPAPKSSKKPGR